MEALSEYTIDLIERANAGRLDPVIGREKEVRRTLQILGRRIKNNPVLVGEPGVGKTAIVEALAQRIAAKEVPSSMQDRRLLALDLPGLLAGTRYRGDFEDRLKRLVSQVLEAPDVILFIDEIHTIVGAGASEGAVDAGNMLKPVLARGEFTCIGATTTDEYSKYLAKDKALLRRFQPVLVQEPSRLDALTILRGIKEKYESHHGVRIADGALTKAVDIASEYLPGRFLPDKAIDLMDEAASQLRLESESVPDALAEAQQVLLRMEIECRALQSEDVHGAQRRLGTAREELGHQKMLVDDLRQRWQRQRGIVEQIRQLLEVEEELRQEEQQNRRAGQLDRAAEILFRALPEISQRIEALEADLRSQQDGGLALRDEVTAQDIVNIARAWLGNDELG